MYDIVITEWEAIGRLLIALGLGLAIGIERTQAGGQAGLRTYGLVALGSASFVVISTLVTQQYSGATNFDPLRVAAQIVVGVGFLGAGVMYTNREGTHGLTTAAGMWVGAAIGTTLLVIFTFGTLQRVEDRYLRYKKDN